MTSRELCRRCQITLRSLQWWCDTGIIRLDRLPHEKRHFDDRQALTVAITAELRRKHVPLGQIATLLKVNEPKGDFLVVCGAAGLYCNADTLLSCVVAAPSGCFVVSLVDLRARLNGAIPRARKASA